MKGAIILRINGKFCVFLGAAYDLEGTVVNLEKLHYAAHRGVAGAFGLTLPADIDEVRKLIGNFVGGPDRKVMEQIRELAIQRGVSAEIIDQWTVEKMLEYKDALFDGQFREAVLKPRKGVARSMQMVESVGVPYGICSVTRSLQAREIIERSGLEGSLSGRPILFRPDVAHGKPAPDVYIKVAEHMGIKPEHLLVFEDSKTGVEAGKASGATVFAVPTAPPGEGKPSIATVDDLYRAGADKVFNGWSDVNSFVEREAHVFIEGAVMGNLQVVREGRILGSLVRAFSAIDLVHKEGWSVMTASAERPHISISPSRHEYV